MDISTILSKIDHTMLGVTSTWEDIKTVCDDAVNYKTASVCIPPCYVKQAAVYVEGKTKICTVIGFPNGYMTKGSKCFEASDSLKNGADEIDMVINIGLLKDKKYDLVLDEIKTLREICRNNILKVIIETCHLNEYEKVKMCEIVTEAKADFIKTSTGFSTGGATREDIILFSKNIGSQVKIKAAGGISSIGDADDFIKLGAERLGTSRVIKLLKSEAAGGY